MFVKKIQTFAVVFFPVFAYLFQNIAHIKRLAQVIVHARKYWKKDHKKGLNFFNKNKPSK